MPFEIKSNSNKLVKLAKDLRLKKHRDKYKLFLVEGYKNCLEILKTEVKIMFMLVTEDFYNKTDREFIENIAERKIKLFKIPGSLFNTVSTEETPQGVLLVAEKKNYKLEDCIKDKKRFILIIDRIQDPGNLGTILRTAAAFDISGVLLTEGTVDLYNPKVVRASAGFLFNIPVVENANIYDAINTLSKFNFSIIATGSKEGKEISDIKLKFPLALIIGNEGKGLDEGILRLSKDCIKISISPEVDSLNASVAAGILVYEIDKRRIYER